MPYRSLIMAALMAALVFMAFRWYQAEQALAVCRQDMQAAQRLMAMCQPVVERNNQVLFQEAMKYLMTYPTETGKKLQNAFLSLDTLNMANLDGCDRINVSDLTEIVNIHADYIRTITDQDSLIGMLIQKTVQGCRFSGEYADSLLRKQAKLKLSLLQNIVFNYLCIRTPRPDMRFSTNYPVLAPFQCVARLGQPFEAQIVLGNPITPNHLSRVDVTVNGKVCPLVHGMADFKTTFQKPGLHELRLKAVTQNLFTGEIQTSVNTVAVLVSE